MLYRESDEEIDKVAEHKISVANMDFVMMIYKRK